MKIILFQGLFIPCECWWREEACSFSARLLDWTWNSKACSTDQLLAAWRCGVRSHHVQPNQVCLHWWERMRQGLGHQSARQQSSCLPTGLPAKGQLHPINQATARWKDSGGWWGSKHALYLGPCISHSSHQGRADIKCSSMLCTCHQPWFKSLLQLLQRWQHWGLGSSQPNSSPPVPRSHRRSQLHWHLIRWYKALDWSAWQHCQVLGSARRPSAEAAWL